MKQQFDLFMSDLENKNKSQATIKAYSNDLRTFLAWLNVQGYKSMTELKIRDLNAYMQEFKECNPTTKNRKIASLKSFFKFLYINEFVEENIANKLENAKVPDKKVVIMEDAEVEKVLNAVKLVKEDGKNEQRDYLMLKLLFNSGIRREELINIKLQDLNMNENSILIHGKGNKERYVYFNEEVKKTITEYLDWVRCDFKYSYDSDYLLLSQQSKSVCKAMVNNIVDKYYNLAGVKVKGRGVHQTRKVFATKAYENTGDIYAVADALGHSNINTTRIYAQIGKERAKATSMSVNF